MHDDQRVHQSNPKAKGCQAADGTKTSGTAALPGAKRSGADPSAFRSQEQESRVIKSGVRIALVHDWLNGMRGGEAVFEALLDLFPNADVFTLVYEPKLLSPRLREKLSQVKVHTSVLNRFAFTRKRYRQLLPILPFLIRQFDVYPYDLVVSSSHCVAKGVRKHPEAFHLSYIHAPMRYMWDRFNDYFGPGRMGLVPTLIAKRLRPFFQAWDKATAQGDRIDVLIANSKFIAAKIKQFYERDAVVVYPFAKLERFNRPRSTGGFYLMVGAFAPYKRTDLAIEAFARLGLPLKIVGEGQDQAKLWHLKVSLNARNIEFLGNPSNEAIEALYAECKAFIFPGKEDFGITPVEAMAAGAPVIAFGEGGASETVIPETGILFKAQSVDALCEAIMEIESGRAKFDESRIRSRAQLFTQQKFKSDFLSYIPDRFFAEK